MTPLKKEEKPGIFFEFIYKWVNMTIIKNDGNKTAIKDTIAPFQPLIINPIYEATFIAIGPGKKLAIVIASRILAFFIILFLIENSYLIMEINII